MKHKNTQPLYIFNRENPQNSEPQIGPRSGLDYIALYNSEAIYGWLQRLCRPPNAQNIYLPILYVHLDRGTTTR